jgi:hypothetical protein
MKVREHPLAVLDLAAAQAPRVRPVQAGRVTFEPGIVQMVGLLPECTGDEANDHDADSIAGA